MKLGLYIHVPFCQNRKCDYCDFYSIPVAIEDSKIEHYVYTVKQEIREQVCFTKNYSIDTIYFGGGTPSLLAPQQVEDILSEVYKHNSVSHDCEISVECNPEHIMEGKAAAFCATGVTRLTLGVQTLDNNSHKAIGRSSRIVDDTVLDAFFNHKNCIHAVDLISGIPNQQTGDFFNDLRFIASYKPEHISVYSLTIEQNTPLYKKISETESLNAFQRVHMETAIDFLEDCGYLHYEISNFCITGFESKHNMKYWTFEPYIGVGPGAHSFISNRRYVNNMEVTEYLSEKSFSYHEDIRSFNDQIVEFVMMGLRLLGGLSLNKLCLQTGLSDYRNILKKARELSLNNKLLITNMNNDIIVKLTKEGLFFLDSIVYELVKEYL